METDREKILSLFQSHQLASIELAFMLSEQTGDFWKLRQFIKKHKGDVVPDYLMYRMYEKVHRLLVIEGITDMDYDDYCHYYMCGFGFLYYIIFDLCEMEDRGWVSYKGAPFSHVLSVEFRERRYYFTHLFSALIEHRNFKDRMSLNQGITEYLTTKVPNVGLKILIADYIFDYPIHELYYSIDKEIPF